MRRSAVAVLLPIVFAACSSANAPNLKLLDTRPRPAKDAVSIKIFKTEPNRPYDTIAIWTASDHRSTTSTVKELQRGAVRQAARLGADAVIFSTKSDSYQLWDQAFTERHEKPARATGTIFRTYARAELIVFK